MLHSAIMKVMNSTRTMQLSVIDISLCKGTDHFLAINILIAGLNHIQMPVKVTEQ